MSSLVKTETGLGVQGRTYLKEIGKTEFTWTIENVREFQTLVQTPISPKFSIGETERHGTFHLKLTIHTTREAWSHYFYLVKDQPGTAMIKVKLLNTNIKGLKLLEKTFSISEKEEKQLCYSYGGCDNEVVLGIEFTCIEPASE